MAIVLSDLKTSFEGCLVDAQFDYFGARLAMADTSGKIVIEDQTEVTGKHNTQTISNAHEGAVAQISWFHPHFENMLISGGEHDKLIKIWKEVEGTWQLIDSQQTE